MNHGADDAKRSIADKNTFCTTHSGDVDEPVEVEVIETPPKTQQRVRFRSNSLTPT